MTSAAPSFEILRTVHEQRNILSWWTVHEQCNNLFFTLMKFIHKVADYVCDQFINRGTLWGFFQQLINSTSVFYLPTWFSFRKQGQVDLLICIEDLFSNVNEWKYILSYFGLHLSVNLWVKLWCLSSCGKNINPAFCMINDGSDSVVSMNTLKDLFFFSVFRMINLDSFIC